MNAIYLNNTTPVNVSPDSVIPVSVVHRAGQFIIWMGNVANIVKPGYYKITATVTCSAQEADDVTITVQKNGVNIPGFTATESISTANTVIRTLTVQGMIKILCHEGPASITLFNDSDVEISVTNASMIIDN